jgi:hypothetical protein
MPTLSLATLARVPLFLCLLAPHLWLANALGEEAQGANKLRQPFLVRRVKSEFERAVQLDPRSVAARRGLMDVYMIAPGVMGGSKDKAREQAVEIAKISPLQGRLAAASIAQREKNAEAAEREAGRNARPLPDWARRRAVREAARSR